MLRRGQKLAAIAAVLLGFATSFLVIGAADHSRVGTKLDSYRGVSVYDNGLNYSQSHGRHFAKDGYYYGKKWQCVEFAKRFFHQAHQHEMPDVWGHAKSFFDEAVPHGKLNPRRGLLQFRNGGNIYPKAGDLVVFTNGGFGHVAIISSVTTNSVEVIQQNVMGHPRQRFPLKWTRTTFLMGDSYQPAGWLRIPKKQMGPQARGSRQAPDPGLSSPHG